MIGRFIAPIIIILLLSDSVAAKSIKCFYDFGSHKEFVIVSESDKGPSKLNIKMWNEGDYEGEPLVFKDINSRNGIFVYDKSYNSSSTEVPIWPIVGFVDFNHNTFGQLFAFEFRNFLIGNDTLVKHGVQRTPWICERLD